MMTYPDHVNYLVPGKSDVLIEYSTDTGDSVHIWDVRNTVGTSRVEGDSFTIANMVQSFSVRPFLKLNGTDQYMDVYALFVQNDDGTYALPEIPGLGKGSAVVKGPEGMSVSQARTGEGGLLLTIHDAEDVRGEAVLAADVDMQSTLVHCRIHAFIVGPIVDAIN